MTAPRCGRTCSSSKTTPTRDLALAEVLEDVNYRPLHAANGEAALEKLRAATPAPASSCST